MDSQISGLGSFHLPSLKLDRITIRILNVFWVGYVIYVLFYTLTASGSVNFVMVQLAQSFGLILMLLTFLKVAKFKFDNKYLRVVFLVYFSWLMSIVVRGFTTDYEVVKALLFDVWFGLFIYSVPLLVLLPRNLAFYRKIFRVIHILGLLSILLYVYYLPILVSTSVESDLSRDVLEIIARTLSVVSCFTLITYPFHSRARKWTAFVVVGLTIFLAVFQARRGLIFMALAPMLLTYFIYIFRAKVKLYAIIVSAIAVVSLSGYAAKVYFESETFAYLQKRGLEDTRSGVEEVFFQQMEVSDWIFGRGMNGAYFCPGIDLGNATGWRTVIETDFLQIILKGGLISLVLLLLILIPAIYKGFFKSNNSLAKAAAWWILLALINMYPATVNTCTMNYVLVWICVGICYSPHIRNMSESLVRSYFQMNLRN